ncbi:MAG: hypothetical protein B7Y31_06245 [Novosphingobium sp. 16-62-11]|nr:MAG: hypothetical protein B7Y31_06245 [Novosphingobium sp. 16-62-11]
MERPKSARRTRKESVLPPAALGQCLLPFALPILITMALAVTVGESWPRNIAPGSGLKLAGLVATAFTGAAVWCLATRQVDDRRVRKGVAILCAVTALMGWPVWSVGVLPSVNGIALGPEKETPMRMTRLEITTPSKGGRGFYHWAWLEPLSGRSALPQGRVFIAEAVHAKWTAERSKIVTLHHAKGMLGAEVLTGFD